MDTVDILDILPRDVVLLIMGDLSIIEVISFMGVCKRAKACVESSYHRTIDVHRAIIRDGSIKHEGVIDVIMNESAPESIKMSDYAIAMSHRLKEIRDTPTHNKYILDMMRDCIVNNRPIKYYTLKTRYGLYSIDDYKTAITYKRISMIRMFLKLDMVYKKDLLETESEEVVGILSERVDLAGTEKSRYIDTYHI